MASAVSRPAGAASFTGRPPSRAPGRVEQEVSLPFDAGTATAVADSIMAGFAAGEYPHLAEFATQHAQQPGYDFGGQFEFGLDLIVDALAAHLDRQAPRGHTGHARRSRLVSEIDGSRCDPWPYVG
jgi:hypothetical protein